MSHVEIDRNRCEGHGLCEQTAPEVYRLNDEGELELLIQDMSPELQDKAETGARICPVAALRVVGIAQRQ
ncbi:ferredoxin [Mycobacteroides abscessus subsp. bolletii]|uniref:ferredoxin n=1 Tax=Mycobacteroides abscessus TaxID=36809 RepID=UPI0009A743A1|nr:ferredoxin [Mycobacteroides abscessus]SKG69467.1 ferredoxin [Mycobacteroides abscessus subsp. bolletii]SKH12730.1 ferredoxin [Mycobacteroides abscessus subsp. bolletii]